MSQHFKFLFQMSVQLKLRSLARLQCQCMSTTARSPHVEDVLTEYDQARPFSEIPGPKGLPYIGTMLLYRNGMTRALHRLDKNITRRVL